MDDKKNKPLTKNDIAVKQLLSENDVFPRPEAFGTIYLTDTIYSDSVVEVASKLSVMARADYLSGVELVINSFGGCVEDGLMLCDIIDAQAKNVRTVALGSCLSMAIPIFLMGDERVASENTCFGTHEITASVYHHTFSQLKVEAECIEKMNDCIYEIFRKRTKMRSKKTIRERFFKEGGRMTYFGAKEALEWGVIHEIA